MEPDPSFDRYARLVCRTLGTLVALVSLIEPGRQVFPGGVVLERRQADPAVNLADEASLVLLRGTPGLGVRIGGEDADLAHRCRVVGAGGLDRALLAGRDQLGVERVHIGDRDDDAGVLEAARNVPRDIAVAGTAGFSAATTAEDDRCSYPGKHSRTHFAQPLDQSRAPTAAAAATYQRAWRL